MLYEIQKKHSLDYKLMQTSSSKLIKENNRIIKDAIKKLGKSTDWEQKKVLKSNIYNLRKEVTESN